MSSTGLGLLIYSKNKPLVYDFFNVGCLDNDVTEKNRQDIKKPVNLCYPAFNLFHCFVSVSPDRQAQFPCLSRPYQPVGNHRPAGKGRNNRIFSRRNTPSCNIIMKMYLSAANSFQQVAFFTILSSRFHE